MTPAFPEHLLRHVFQLEDYCKLGKDTASRLDLTSTAAISHHFL